MEGIGTWYRSTLRRRRWGLLALGLAVGLGLGFTMVCFAGARRADTAYDRLREATLAPDALVDANDVPEADIPSLVDSPGVLGFARFTYVPVAPEPLVPGVDGGAFTSVDSGFMDTVYRPVPIDGRLPRADHAADEVVVNEAMAEAGPFEIGQEVTLRYSDENHELVDLGPATVVGIVRGTFDVGQISGNPAMALPPAFFDDHPEVQVSSEGPGAMFRLADGPAGVDDVTARVADIVGHPVSGFSAADEAQAVERTLNVQVVALLVLGGVALAAVLLAAIQAAGRVLDGPLAELDLLIAIGVSPRRRYRIVPLLLVPIAVVAVVVAAVTSVLGSPRIPTGFAREVDPTSGVQVDVTVIAAVMGVWLLTLLAAALVIAGRHHWRTQRATGRSHEGLLRHLPVVARLGTGAALAPARGRGGAAARSALLAAALGTAGFVAVSTFSASLDHLVDTPRLSGWDFEATISSGEMPIDDLEQQLAPLADDPGVEGVTFWTSVQASAGGKTFEAYAFDPETAGVHPTLRWGDVPEGDDEMALGAGMLDVAHAHRGDVIPVGGPNGEVDLRVVGSMPFPSVGNNGDLSNSMSLPLTAARQAGMPELGSFAMVDLAPGADPGLLDAYVNDQEEVVLPFLEHRVQNLQEVGDVPTVLAAFLALLGLSALLHSLVRAIQGRRHDLAVFTVLGLRRRNLRALTAWQSVTTVVVGGAVGILLGWVVGRLTWSSTAASAGVVENVVLPVGLLAVVGVIVVIAAFVLAEALSRILVRRSTALALRTD